MVAYINKDGGDEVGPSVYPSVESFDLVYQQTGYSQSLTHPGAPECGSRQAIQTGPDHSNRVVSPSRGIPGNMRQVAPTTNQPFCNKVQQQADSVCVTSARLPGLCSGHSQPTMGGSGPLCLSPSCHLGQSGGKVTKQPMQQNHSDSSGLAKHALVLVTMSSQIPLSLPNLPNLLTQPFNQESVKLKSACMAPRATAIQEHGFSEELRLLKEKSTRSVYEAKWSIFAKWCCSNQVDFRAPPVKPVADFLMYLFQDRKLQPSTIDGYRSAIADKLGNSSINISKVENLTRLLDSFHRDRPKGQRGIPSWNLSLVFDKGPV